MSAPPADARSAGADRRDDIQGLRALAVLMVVAFHAGLPVPGGFTGPDVFFVVSGFVITGMLLREWRSTGGIAIGRFYLRRARRLMPALALLSVVTLTLAAIVFSPIGPRQEVTARAVRAATTITANLYFLRETGGYFQPAAQDNPFLHTWTLAVEEQFYVVFPIACLGLWWIERRWRRAGAAIVVLSLACLASLGASVALSYGRVPTVWPRLATWIASFDPERVAFFTPATRAWEFLAGVLLAVAAAKWRPGRLVAGVAATAGIVLLVAAMAAVRSTDVFPGLAALLPVMATLGLLTGGLAAAAPVATRILSVKPLVWLGDRSYSWYLWHWPLIVFARTFFAGATSALLAAGAVSLVPAVLSFRYVEEPIRRRRVWPSPRAAVGIAAVCITLPLACAAAFTAAVERGWGDRDLARIRNSVVPSHMDTTAGCASLLPLGDPGRAPCIWPGRSRGTMLLIGDSNAGHFAEPFVAAAGALGDTAQVITAGGCPFLRRPVYASESCREFVERSLVAIARRKPAYAGVIVSNATLGYLNGGLAPQFIPDASPGAPVTRRAEITGWVASVGRLVQAIAPHAPVIVVGAVPQFSQVPQCLRPTFFSAPAPGCGVWTPAFAAAWRTDVITEERATVLSLGAAYLDAGARLCPAGNGCTAFIDGLFAYRDGAHLNVDASMRFEPDFRAAMSALTGPQP